MKLFGKSSGDAPKADAPKPAVTSTDRPKTGLPELDENPRLFKLMLSALEKFWAQVVARGEESPLAMIEAPSGQFVQGFRRDRLELGHEEARRALLAAPSDAERYALAWAGYLTIQGVRYETVLVGGGERGKERGAIIGQRYKQNLPETKFQPIGNLAILGPGDNLLTIAGNAEAASKLRPLFARITADVDHNRSTARDKALTYEFKRCQEVVLSFGDLDLPFSKELQKKPDTVHVATKRGIWATFFKPEAKEIFLSRDMLTPIRGNEPFPGFKEDGMIMIGYMPPPSTGDKPVELRVLVLWAAEYRITDKETTGQHP